jgi:hypothetical protein
MDAIPASATVGIGLPDLSTMTVSQCRVELISNNEILPSANARKDLWIDAVLRSRKRKFGDEYGPQPPQRECL